jgi:hypothetical protein
MTELPDEVALVGYMPQVYQDGAWQDALSRCVDMLDTAHQVTSVVKATPTRIIQRKVVDQVVWL